MRRIGIVLLLLCLRSEAQTIDWRFRLTDTAFRLNATYTTPLPLGVGQGHSVIRPEEQTPLDSIAALIRNHPGMVLMIGCHSDQRGSDTANIDFTQQQAEIIADYLRTKGIPLLAVAPVGFGERRPLHSEDEIEKVTDKAQKEKLYAENRRVEYTILQTPRETFTLHDSTFTAGAYLCYPFRFVLGKRQLDSISYPFLDSLAAFLIAHPQLEVRVENHQDSRSSNKSSDHLSLNRSKSITDYLAARGVASYRIQPYGYGDVRPMVNDIMINTAPGRQGKEVLHALNRRTEIRIMKINGPVSHFHFTDTSFVAGSIQSRNNLSFNEDELLTLAPESFPYLDSLAQFLISNRGIIMEIDCYIDVPGTTYLSPLYSQERAELIILYLVAKGVDTLSLVAIGYGESRPVWTDPLIAAEKDSVRREAMHAENRRIVFRILHWTPNTFTFNDTTFKEGSELILPVRYATGTTIMNPGSEKLLDSLAVFLVRHPELTVEIGVCEEVNYPHSSKLCVTCSRVTNISAYLNSKGVNQAQYTCINYKDAPAIIEYERLFYSIPLDAPKKRADLVNQRTVIKIVKVAQ